MSWGLWGISRQAMPWPDWAPKIEGGCESCEHAGNGDGAYGEFYVEHPDGSGKQPGDLMPGLNGRSMLQFFHDVGKDGQPEIYISGIHTDSKHRNDGVAEALIRHLHITHPDVRINPGFMTDDGLAFRNRMLEKEPNAKGFVTAMGQRGPLPENLTFKYWPEEAYLTPEHVAVGSIDLPAVTAHIGDDPESVGHLSWIPGHPDDYRREMLENHDEGTTIDDIAMSGFGQPIGSHPGDQDYIGWPTTISNISVADEWQRHGIADAMFDYAKTHHYPELRHSFDLTPDGAAWSEHEQNRRRDVLAHFANMTVVPNARLIEALDWHSHNDEQQRIQFKDKLPTDPTFLEPTDATWHNPADDWEGDEPMTDDEWFAAFDHPDYDPTPRAYYYDNPPRQQTWYHVSPHEMNPGDVLIPGHKHSWDNRPNGYRKYTPPGGHGFVDDEFENPLKLPPHDNSSQANYVWMAPYLKPDPKHYEEFRSNLQFADGMPAEEQERRARDAFAQGGRHFANWWAWRLDMPELGDMKIYEVRPTEHPQPWNLSWGHGWAAPSARVVRRVPEHEWKSAPAREEILNGIDELQNRRTAAAIGEDLYDVQQKAMRDALAMHHYMETGEHPEIGGFAPGATVAHLPAAHHPLLTNHWAAESLHPEPISGPFGNRVQSAALRYVENLTDVAENGPGGHGGAGDRLDFARNGLRVELQHGGHFRVPNLASFSGLPRPNDASKLKAVNPRFAFGMEGPNQAHAEAHQVNCQRSCLASDARHRGYNVEAERNYYDPINDPQGSDEQWGDEDLAAFWRDKDNYPTQWIDAEDHFGLTAPGPKHWDLMHEHIAGWGPGARGLVAMTSLDPAPQAGKPPMPFRHVIMAHVGKNSHVRFVDPQAAMEDASHWRDRIVYGGHPLLYTPEERSRADSHDDPLFRLMFRNRFYSPLRFTRIDDKRLHGSAAKHLIDRGTAGAVPIYPLYH